MEIIEVDILDMDIGDGNIEMEILRWKPVCQSFMELLDLLLKLP